MPRSTDDPRKAPTQAPVKRLPFTNQTGKTTNLQSKVSGGRSPYTKGR